MLLIRKILCKVFNQHKPELYVEVYKTHVKSKCKYCGKPIVLIRWQ